MASNCSRLSQIFEKELHRRLQTKSSQYASESMNLLSAFKFYDSLNTGYIDKSQWIKSFSKVGLTGFKDPDLAFLFDYYDNNQTGLINYRDFTLYFLNPINQFSTNLPQTPQSIAFQTKLYYERQLESLRSKINTNDGMTYYMLLSKLFKTGYRLIHFESLGMILREMGIDILVKDLKNFFNLIKANEQWIASNTLLKMIRGRLGNDRKKIILKCFDKIEKDDQGGIRQDRLSEGYNPDNMELGSKSKEDAVNDYKFMLGIYCEWKKIHSLQLEDFIEFHEPISSSIENDDTFNSLMEATCPIQSYKNDNTPEIKSRNIYDENIIEEDNTKEDHIYNMKQRITPNSQRIQQTPQKLCVFSYQDQDQNQSRNKSHFNEEHKQPYTRLMINKSQSLHTPIKYTPVSSNHNPIFLKRPTANDYSKAFIHNSHRLHLQPQNILPEINVNQSSQLPKLPTPFNRRYAANYNKMIINPITSSYYCSNNISQRNDRPIGLSRSYSHSQLQAQPLYSNSRTPNLKLVPSKSLQVINESSNNSLNLLRQLLGSRGEKGVFGLLRIFNTYDKYKTNHINFNDFLALAQAYCLNLSKDSLEALFTKYQSDNNSGLMSYNSFVNDIIGEMNSKRENIIKRIFIQLDPQSLGMIKIEDLKEMYNASKHPEVKEGRKSESEVFGEWLDNIEAFCSYYGLDINSSSMILEDFINFHAAISLSINDDEYFEYMIYNIYNLEHYHYAKRRNIVWY